MRLTVTPVVSTALNHVAHVVSLRANLKMIDVDAGWVIALVANNEAVRDMTASKFVHQPVGPLQATLDAKETVSPCVLLPNPNKALAMLNGLGEQLVLQ